MKLLFVCVENSCRSQMAEAFARSHGDHEVEAFSAGSRPSGSVDPRAIAFMRELGFDLGAHSSKSVDDVVAHAPFDAVVTMGCGDECPHVPTRQRMDWEIDDPKRLPDDDFRAIRDRIGRLVEDLILVNAEAG